MDEPQEIDRVDGIELQEISPEPEDNNPSRAKVKFRVDITEKKKDNENSQPPPVRCSILTKSRAKSLFLQV